MLMRHIYKNAYYYSYLSFKIYLGSSKGFVDRLFNAKCLIYNQHTIIEENLEIQANENHNVKGKICFSSHVSRHSQ